MTALAAWLVCFAHWLPVTASPLASSLHSNIFTRQSEIKSEYDYIIVGGGTAGLVVADRLTENGQFDVLVIERGSFDNGTSVTTISGGANGLMNSSHLFNFPSVPQSGLKNRTAGVIGGVMLGGSSGVNGLQVHRGMKDDYNSWSSFFGNSSQWGWDDLLPYFKKAWRFHPPSKELAEQFDIKYDESYWGQTSEIHASFPSFLWPMLKHEVAAHSEIEGVDFPPDSGAGQPGVFWYPTSADPESMTRSMSRMAHWDAAHRRENYDTLTQHKVLSVLFEGDAAIGVALVPSTAVDKTQLRTVSARKEVIVAAGTIHTPQILQASGVGPRSVLEAASVDVVVDLPGVGSNFQDHPQGGIASFRLDNFTIHPDSRDLSSNATFRNTAQAEWAAYKTGPLSIASGNAASFLPFPVVAPNAYEDIAGRLEAQDPAAYLPSGIDPTVVAGYQAQKAALAKFLRSRGSAVYNSFFRGTTPEAAIVFLHPTSRGIISIDPRDPFFRNPVVDFRGLTNPIDVDILAEFTKFTRRYWLSTSLRVFAPVETAPGAHLTTARQLEDSFRSNVSPTCFHPVGTAAMLPRELGGVVGQDLLVHGVRGLSVVDASVMPLLPGAYTQQTVYAVAEKAADLIKQRA
ncbi:glucose oxidase [Paramyrothecium foliicola]|nr:glucose oxidase [Paramyrothecium foliicola]